DLGRIVLAIDRQSDLFLLEAVENVGVRDRVIALVVDLANAGLFTDKNVEDDALFRVLALDAQVFEVARIPERVEVTLDRDGIVSIALMGKEPGEDGLPGNAAVADHANLSDRLRGLRRGCAGRDR